MGDRSLLDKASETSEQARFTSKFPSYHEHAASFPWRKLVNACESTGAEDSNPDWLCKCKEMHSSMLELIDVKGQEEFWISLPCKRHDPQLHSWVNFVAYAVRIADV